MSDAPDLRARRRVRWAVALLLTGLAVAFVPALLARDEFVTLNYPLEPLSSLDHLQPWRTMVIPPSTRTVLLDGHAFQIRSLIVDWSLLDLVLADPAWAISLATLLCAPLVFGWWRHSAASFVRLAGIACSAAPSAAVCALVLSRWPSFGGQENCTWAVIPLGGGVMAAAFLVAPPPLRRDDA